MDARRDGGRSGVPRWPLVLLIVPAFVAIWSGWVGLGAKTGFGVIHPLPGIADGFTINTAIVLPIGMEAYAAFALLVWLTSAEIPQRARTFARRSSLTALTLGCLGQVAFHLMEAAGWRQAPWMITMLVAIVPVGVLGMGAALAHLLQRPEEGPAHEGTAEPVMEPDPVVASEDWLAEWQRAREPVLPEPASPPALPVPASRSVLVRRRASREPEDMDDLVRRVRPLYQRGWGRTRVIRELQRQLDRDLSPYYARKALNRVRAERPVRAVR